MLWRLRSSKSLWQYEPKSLLGVPSCYGEPAGDSVSLLSAKPMQRHFMVDASLFALATALCVGCHHTGTRTASAPTVWPTEEHCWWAPLRTAMLPDSVAARYSSAYTSLGLSGARWSHAGDTAWAEAGPTFVERAAGSAVYAARVVAYRRGDTTLVRPFVAVRSEGSASVGSLSIPFCGDAMRAAHAATTQPRDEERDDSLPLWRRRAVQ